MAPSAPQCAAGAYGTANHDIAAEPDRSKRPGDREQCRGPTSAHRSSPVALHQPSVACNSGARTFCSTPKRCNPNDVMSMFEMFTRELHATFLWNHNTGPQRTPSRRQLKPRRRTSPGDAHIPGNRPHPRPPQLPEARGATPDLGHCTRSGALHPNRRGALPTDRVQRPNTQEQTRNWQSEPLPHHNQPGHPP